MKTIQINSKKHGKFIVKVDDEDYNYVKQFKWSIRIAGNNKYARRLGVLNNKATTILMHREILNLTDGRIVDHIDHDGLNNQKHNIRICTKSGNNKNKSSAIGSSSKYLGVCIYLSKEEKFSNKTGEIYIYERVRIEAAIRINGKTKRIGYFKTEEEAAIAYNKYAIKYHKEFANLNKIGGYNG